MRFLEEVLGGGAFWLSRSLPVLVIKPSFLGLTCGIVSAFAVPLSIVAVLSFLLGSLQVSIVISYSCSHSDFIHRSISHFSLQSSRSAPLFITVSLPRLLLDIQLAIIRIVCSLPWCSPSAQTS